MLWIEAVSVSLIVIVLVVLLVPLRLALRSWTSSGSRAHRFPRWDRRWCSPSSALWALRAPPRWAARRASRCAPFPRAVLQCAIAGRRLLHALLVLRGAGLSRRIRRAQRLHQPAAPAGRQGRRLAAGRGHRLRRAGQHVCLRAGLHHGSRAGADAHGARQSCCPPLWSAPAAATALRAAAIALSAAADVCRHGGAGACAALRGSDMYDLLGSLSVFGFLTAYALVALALPFARRAVGQHSLAVTASACSRCW